MGSCGYLNQQGIDNPVNPSLKLKNLRLSNVITVIIGNLNVNSLTNNLDQLKIFKASR